MPRTMLAFVIVTVMLVAPRAQATPATCTVLRLDAAGTFPFFNIGAIGLELPVDIDAAAGRFTLQRDAFTTPYPSPGLKFPTGFGTTSGWLEWDPAPVEGTIDSNGQIALPNFGMRFWTDLGSEGGAPSVVGAMNPTLSTGIQAQAASTRFWLFYGQAIGSDGVLRLVGTGSILYAGLALQTGTGLTCQLSPVPNLAEMPKGPTLVSAKGKVKPGPDANAADDGVTLVAVLASGARPLPVDGAQDVLLRLKGATGEPLNLVVPGNHLQAKGKKLSLQDTDGSVIQAISDQPPGTNQPPAPAPTTGGSLVVKKTKKGAILTFKVTGLETAQLSGQVEVTVGVGAQSASRQVTFVAGKKGSKFH